MSDDKERQAQIAAVNALVGTQNPDLVQLGLTMLPQDHKDNLKAIADNVTQARDFVHALIAKYPNLAAHLSDDAIREAVPGGWLSASDAVNQLRFMTDDDEEKIKRFFETIAIDGATLNISMVYLCVLPMLINNTHKQDPDHTAAELREGIYQEFITRLHAVPHDAPFPDTPNALRAALEACFEPWQEGSPYVFKEE